MKRKDAESNELKATMPELPEVETLVRQLQPLLKGAVLLKCDIQNSEILTSPRAKFTSELPGKKIRNVVRRGKYIAIHLEDESHLWFHLGMTGQLLWVPASSKVDKHTHLQFYFKRTSDTCQDGSLRGAPESDVAIFRAEIASLPAVARNDDLSVQFPHEVADVPHKLVFRDIRKFGEVFFGGSSTDVPEGVKLLAKDPFELSAEDFIQKFKKRTGKIKSLLLDQRLVAGLGNIYASESLFRAGIRPQKRANQISRSHFYLLYHKITELLEEAIQSGGSSIDDYLHADGSRGTFQKRHQVYGRDKKLCFHCGHLIRKMVLAARSSFYCPKCQK